MGKNGKLKSFFSRKLQNSEKFRVFQQKLISAGGKDAGSTFLPRNTFVLPDLPAMIRRTLWIFLIKIKEKTICSTRPAELAELSMTAAILKKLSMSA